MQTQMIATSRIPFDVMKDSESVFLRSSPLIPLSFHIIESAYFWAEILGLSYNPLRIYLREPGMKILLVAINQTDRFMDGMAEAAD